MSPACMDVTETCSGWRCVLDVIASCVEGGELNTVGQQGKFDAIDCRRSQPCNNRRVTR